MVGLQVLELPEALRQEHLQSGSQLRDGSHEYNAVFTFEGILSLIWCSVSDMDLLVCYAKPIGIRYNNHHTLEPTKRRMAF